MTPDIEVRLLSVIKSLEEIIIPALDPSQSLAQEQAATALLHLKVIRGQSAYVADYLTLCLDETALLGRELVAIAAGGPETRAAAIELDQAIRSATAPDQKLYTLAQRRDGIAAAIDTLIDASARDGSPPFLQSSLELILHHGYTEATRDRAWFKAAGLDPDAAILPAPAELVEPLGATRSPNQRS